MGYKAFCYLLTGKMTPEGMKPEEAAASAAALEAERQDEAAQEIYRRIQTEHPWPQAAKWGSRRVDPANEMSDAPFRIAINQRYRDKVKPGDGRF
ncbi:MAG: hypothetical protein IPJ94_26490 [Chloroflexi bacterium]|nr:hypothetical protein [Chloroflexota bacterium]